MSRPFDLGKLDTESLRKARRKRLLLYSSPVIGLVLLISIKLLSVTIGYEVGMGLYNKASYQAAAQVFALPLFVNVIEPYKAYFNRGTAELRAQNFTAAENDLDTALASAPDDHICKIQINLALSYEARGDKAMGEKKYSDASKWYSKASETVAARGCAEVKNDKKNERDSRTQKDGKDVNGDQAQQRAADMKQRTDQKNGDAKDAENSNGESDKSSSNPTKDSSGSKSQQKQPSEHQIDKIKSAQDRGGQSSGQSRQDEATGNNSDKSPMLNDPTGKYW